MKPAEMCKMYCCFSTYAYSVVLFNVWSKVTAKQSSTCQVPSTALQSTDLLFEAHEICVQGTG